MNKFSCQALLCMFLLCISQTISFSFGNRFPTSIISRTSTIKRIVPVSTHLFDVDEIQTTDLAVDAPLSPAPKESFFGVLVRIIRDFDKDKEDSRKARRTVYTSVDWKKHRSSSRYFRELTNLPYSGVIRGLMRQALNVAALSSLIVFYNVLVERKILRSRILPVLTLPALPFTLMSSSLGILLAFRTNTGYARWNDARLNWSQISSKTFDVMRQCLAWLADKETVAKTVRYLVALARTTKWHLTDRTNVKKLQDELNGVLTEEEIYEIVNSKRKPQFVLLCLTKLIARQSLIPNVQSHMDRGLIELSQALENCDRIYTTPIPLVYPRLTARFLMLWLLMFPMVLYKEFSMSKKWLIPIVVFFNSIFLLGIDDLGVQIEEPFSILPLANICYNIQSTAQMVLQTAGIDWFQGTPQHQAAVAAAAAAAAASANAVNVSNVAVGETVDGANADDKDNKPTPTISVAVNSTSVEMNKNVAAMASNVTSKVPPGIPTPTPVPAPATLPATAISIPLVDPQALALAELAEDLHDDSEEFTFTIPTPRTPQSVQISNSLANDNLEIVDME